MRFRGALDGAVVGAATSGLGIARPYGKYGFAVASRHGATLMISAASTIICPCGVTVSTGLPGERTAARNIRERHALADAAARRRRVVLGERLGPFEDDQGARPVAIGDKARVEIGAEDPGIFQKLPYLDQRPFAGRRRLKSHQRDIGGKQR